MRPNLTLNIGVRYEYWTPIDEQNSLYLAPRLENNDVQRVGDGSRTRCWISSAGSSGRPFYKADKNNFAPNVGFAWDPFKNGKTSIRGGYMIAFVNDNVVTTVRNSVTTSSGLSFANTQSNLTGAAEQSADGGGPGLQGAAHAGRQLRHHHDQRHRHARSEPGHALRAAVEHRHPAGNQGHDCFRRATSATRARALLRAIDYNQILYNANGFLADFQRAQNNAALAEKSGLGYVGTYNANVAGSVPLTVFPLLTRRRQSDQRHLPDLPAAGPGRRTRQPVHGEQAERPGQLLPEPQRAGRQRPDQRRRIELSRAAVRSDPAHAARTAGAVQLHLRQVALQYGGRLRRPAWNRCWTTTIRNLEWARSPVRSAARLQGQLLLRTAVRQGQALERQRGHERACWATGRSAASGATRPARRTRCSPLTGRSTAQARSNATNTASVNGTTLGQLAPLMEGLFMTGNGPYFVSPSVIGSDGRGAAQAGTRSVRRPVVLQPDGRQCGQPAAAHVHRSVAVELGHVDQEIVQDQGASFAWMSAPT